MRERAHGIVEHSCEENRRSKNSSPLIRNYSLPPLRLPLLRPRTTRFLPALHIPPLVALDSSIDLHLSPSEPQTNQPALEAASIFLPRSNLNVLHTTTPLYSPVTDNAPALLQESTTHELRLQLLRNRKRSQSSVFRD